MRRHRRFMLHRAFVAGALSLVLLAGGGPAAGATAESAGETPSTAASTSEAAPSPTCERAARLTETGQPGLALELLDRRLGTDASTDEQAQGEEQAQDEEQAQGEAGIVDCAQVRDMALARVSRAEQLAGAIGSASAFDEAVEKSSATGDDTTRQAAEQQLQRVLPGVLPGEQYLPPELRCPIGAVAPDTSEDTVAAWIAAEAHACDAAIEIPAAVEDPTDSERAQASWEDFLTRHVQPLADPVAGAVAAVAAAVVVALLLAWPLGWATTGMVRMSTSGKVTDALLDRRSAAMAFGIWLLALDGIWLVARDVPAVSGLPPWWATLGGLLVLMAMVGFGVLPVERRHPVTAGSSPGNALRYLRRSVPLAAALGLVLVQNSAPFWPFNHDLWGPVLGLGLAAAAIAWALGQRIRISIRVAGPDGTHDEAAAAVVAGYVRELSRTDLRSLETPSPAAAGLVQSAGLTVPPEGALMAFAYRVLEAVLPLSPWEVRIWSASEDRYVVAVSQHGRVVLSDVIERDLLGLRPKATKTNGGSVPPTETNGGSVPPTETVPRPDLQRLCAAVIVAALAERYDMPDLAGASTWQGIGLHFIAKTDLIRHRRERSNVLGRALRLDPGNLALLVQYWHSRYRSSTDPGELGDYARLLQSLTAGGTAGGGPAGNRYLPPALRLQALHSRYVALVNRSFALGRPISRDELEEIRQAVVDQCAAWAELASLPEANSPLSGRLHRTLRANAYGWRVGHDRLPVALHVGGGPGPAGIGENSRVGGRDELTLEDLAPEDLTPRDAFAWACALVSRSAVPALPALDAATPPAESDQTVDLRSVPGDATLATVPSLLHLAEGVTVLSRWRPKDPQLQSVREQAAYRRLFGRPPRGKLTEVSVLKPYVARLTSTQTHDPRELVRWPVDELAGHLGVPRDAARYIQRAARLALSVRAPLQGYRYEITNSMASWGITEVPSEGHAALAARLHRKLDATLKDPPTEQQLLTWLRNTASR